MDGNGIVIYAKTIQIPKKQNILKAMIDAMI